jgi:hypothetical protein
MTDYLENRLIDHLFRGRSFTAPAQLWVGLFTAAPSDAGGGTEVSGGSYARATPGANSDTAWKATQGGTPASASSGTGGQTSNPGTLTFPTPSAAWGQVTHFGIFDAATAGNLLFQGPLTASKTINASDPAPTAVTDAITVTLS